MRYPYYFAHPAPPQLPELPEGVDPRPRWPAWFGPAGFVAGLAATFVAAAAIGVIVSLAGGDVKHASDKPAYLLSLTFVQDLMFVGAALLLASQKTHPRAWHFGLRGTRLWPALGWSALGLVSFWVLSAIYVAAVKPNGHQTVTQDLGANQSTLGLIAAGVFVVCLAPFVEEFFFRGFFYRALRSRLAIVPAALIDGVLFGAVHYTGKDTLSLLPVLAILGVIFCLVYEKTGSLYTVIGLHTLNNSISYGVSVHNAAVPAVLGAITITACVLLPRFTARSAPALT
jgi:membrane protease YdiL (CAAX protease family)